MGSTRWRFNSFYTHQTIFLSSSDLGHLDFQSLDTGLNPVRNTKMTKETIIKDCKIHGSVTFVKHKNGNATQQFRCMKCSADATYRVVQAKRDRAYREIASCCKLCGYNRCQTALEWHHLDPSQKEITPAKVFSRSWEKIVKELSKCVLLCANCHREVHAGMASVG